MVTREQMDTLTTRVSSVLELVSELRIENSHLKAEVEQLKERQDQSDRKIEEQAKESMRLREQLEERNAKLNEMILKEEELENFMLQVIGQMDQVRLSEYQKEFVRVADLKSEGGLAESAAPTGGAQTPAELLQVDIQQNGAFSVESSTEDQVSVDLDEGRGMEVVFDDDDNP